MGKRKTRKPPPKKLADKVPTSFDCPFCNHHNSVECKMNRKEGIGSLLCNVCSTSFEISINSLQQPVDVFCEWLDACQNAQLDAQKSADPALYDQNVGYDDDDAAGQEEEQYQQQQQQQHYQKRHHPESEEEEEEEEEYQIPMPNNKKQRLQYQQNEEEEEEEEEEAAYSDED